MNLAKNSASHEQMKDLVVRVLNINHAYVEGNILQKALEHRRMKDIENHIIAFINNGLRMPGMFFVDRSIFFNPDESCIQGYTIWRGPKDGSGCNGDEDQDAISTYTNQIDLNSVAFTSCRKEGETGLVTHEDRLTRHRAARHIRLDALIGEQLLHEKGQPTLEWLYRVRGVSRFALPGTVIRGTDNQRYVYTLTRVISEKHPHGGWVSGLVNMNENDDTLPSAIIVEHS